MSASSTDGLAIEHYLSALWLERGLSENTLTSYRSDLESCSRWLRNQALDLLSAAESDVQAYLAVRFEQRLGFTIEPRTYGLAVGYNF